METKDSKVGRYRQNWHYKITRHYRKRLAIKNGLFSIFECLRKKGHSSVEPLPLQRRRLEQLERSVSIETHTKLTLIPNQTIPLKTTPLITHTWEHQARAPDEWWEVVVPPLRPAYWPAQPGSPISVHLPRAWTVTLTLTLLGALGHTNRRRTRSRLYWRSSSASRAGLTSDRQGPTPVTEKLELII